MIYIIPIRISFVGWPYYVYHSWSYLTIAHIIPYRSYRWLYTPVISPCGWFNPHISGVIPKSPIFWTRSSGKSTDRKEQWGDSETERQRPKNAALPPCRSCGCRKQTERERERERERGCCESEKKWTSWIMVVHELAAAWRSHYVALCIIWGPVERNDGKWGWLGCPNGWAGVAFCCPVEGRVAFDRLVFDGFLMVFCMSSPG